MQNVKYICGGSNEKEDYYFSVVDVVSALTESNTPKRYWTDLKRKLTEEGSQLYEKNRTFKTKGTRWQTKTNRRFGY